MINGLSGRPGAGKTYEAVTQHIIPALTDKRKIITNIPLNIEWFVNVLGAYVRDLIVIVDGGYHNYGKTRPFSNAQDFLQYDTWRNEKNQGVYFFIDECHLAMPSGGTDKALKEYLSMHRHYGHDLMLLTQNFRKVDRDVKDMVQTCYLCTKLSMLAKDTHYVCKVADGVSRNIVHTHHREYESKYFGAYQSHTKAKGSVKESTTTGVKKWYQRWTTIGAVSMIILSFAILGATFSREKVDHAKKAQEQLQGIKTAEQPQQQPIPVSNVATQQQPPQKEPEIKKPPKSDRHPFAGVQIHLSGYYADYDNRGRYNKIYYFALSRNGSMLSELTHVDMQLAGYTVKIYNPCAAEISYDDYNAFVLCDTPTVAVTMVGDKLAATD